MSALGMPAAAITLALVTALAGCGEDGPADTAAPPAGAAAPSPEPGSDPDPAATFLTALTLDHSEATQLSILYSDTVQPPTNQELDALAGEIEERIEPRMETLFGEFDLPPGARTAPDPAAAERLEAAGTEIDRTFLELILANHRRTVAAARAYLAAGEDPELTKLARAVETELGERIARMERLQAEA